MTLRRLVRDLVHLPSRMARRRTLAQRSMNPPSGEPVLSYGDVLPRSADAIVHGGRVKLLHLRARFPERDDFNLLYLVSSAPPPHAMELVQWAKKRGAKLVWNQNGVAFPAWAGGKVDEFNRPMASLLREAAFVVYQSEFCRVSADRYLGPTASPSSVIFNPVDCTVFSPNPEPHSVGRWELLAAGTHHQAQRVLLPLETLRLLRDFGHDARLTIAGELRWQDSEREVDETIRRLGLANCVTLRPPFTQTQAAELYRGHHVLLHAKYHDPCPTVPIEAMACGVPVVASKSGGMAELLGDDGGELLDVPLSYDHASYPTAEAMARSVERIMRDWPSASRRARARAVQTFDAQAWVDKHAQIFERVL